MNTESRRAHQFLQLVSTVADQQLRRHFLHILLGSHGETGLRRNIRVYFRHGVCLEDIRAVTKEGEKRGFVLLLMR